MDKWGILIFLVGILAYYFSKQKYPFLVFVAGIGAGLLIGAVWAYYIVMNAFP